MKLTRTRKIALGLTLAASAIAGAAYAEQAARGDGVLTRAEAQAKAQEMFARMDVNKDGKLNRLYATFFYVDVVFPERTPMAHLTRGA